MNNETKSPGACYQIPNARLSELKSKVARLAKRAAKLGLDPVALAEHKSDARVCYRYTGGNMPARRYELACTWVELTGPSPVVAGHSFLARVEHTDAGNMVSRVDDGELDLTAYRMAKPVCDHCKSARKRNDTFVLRAPDGSLHQIGRNCLADFLRESNVEIAIGIMALVEELSKACGGGDEMDEFGGGGGYVITTTVADFVAASVAAVRQGGWSPSKSEKPTKNAASFISGPAPMRADDRAAWQEAQPTEADIARGALIVEWIQASTDSSDYMHNLRIAVALNHTTGRTEGLLASSVIAYERHVEGIERKRTEAAKATESTYFGEVGKRYEIAATVKRVHYTEGSYGVVTLLVLADDAGHCFKWFASGSKEVSVGAAVQIKGTVKKHEEYKGTKETVLTRCALTVAA